MTMNNSLNVSELLKRLGVVGDSLGSAPLLEAMRLSINLADLSDLVPPIAVPVGGAFNQALSLLTQFNKWTLHSRAPGGLKVVWFGNEDSGDQYKFWVTEVDPFIGSVGVPGANFSFGQDAVSVFFNAPAGVAVAPPGAILARGGNVAFPFMEGNWIGPGQFFNIEAQQDNQASEVASIMWKEYPGMLNP